MLTDTYRKALLAQSCCGSGELCSFLEDEIDLLYECQDSLCNEQIKYLYTLLGLIEAAQLFSRNKIDTETKNSSSNHQEKSLSKSITRTDSERDSSGKSCNWSASTSQQFFNRSSQDNMVGFSESNSHHTSSKNENGIDTSCRHTTGHGFSLSRVDTKHLGLHGEEVDPLSGITRSQSDRQSSTQGGTSDYVPPTGLEPKLAALAGLNPFSDTPLLSSPFLVDIVKPPESMSSICNSCTGCICHGSDTEVQTCACCICPAEGIPSAGQGWNARFHATLGIPSVFTLSFDWSLGENERQYYHCSTSKTFEESSFRDRQKSLVTGSTDAAEKDNQTRSNELTTIINYVRKYGSSVRRGTGTADAEDISRSRANGIAHSESERNHKGNGFSQNRSESLTTRTGSSSMNKTEIGSSDDISQKYGQISIHLGIIWDRTWNRVKLLERQFIAIPLGASMNCIERRNICPCPVRVSYHDYRNVTQFATH